MATTRRTMMELGLVLSSAVLLACAPDFASPSRLRTLRILAVQKDEPYARPGDTVKLSMLLDDAGQPKPRGVKVTWFGGCENPPGDLYAGCLASLAGVAVPGSSPAPPVVGTGLEFSVRLSANIVSGRPRPVDPRQPPYGLAFVFFAACAGDLKFVPPPDPNRIESLPIQCVDGAGKPLGAEDFVLGYTQIWAYDTFTNRNPIVNGFTLDGNPVTPDCIGQGCVALEAAELGLGAAGADAGADGAALDAAPGDAGPPTAPPDPCAAGLPTCFAVCTKSLSECPKHAVSVDVDPSSAEHDTVQEARDGTTNFLEQMWIDYYVDGGGLDGDVKLLNDATLGWNDRHGVKLSTPNVTGRSHLWAVVHDNRGGVEWARLGIATR